MAIRARQVSKVIISGEWFSVELGTFQIVAMGFTDEEGTLAHEALGVPAYTFLTPNHDRYYGPLSAITLIKLADV
jgi:hypothetical protein